MGHKLEQYGCVIQVMHIHDGVDPGVVTQSGRNLGKGFEYEP